VTINTPAFAIIFAIACLAFIWSCYKRFSLVALGQAENRFDHVLQRIMTVVMYPFAQRCAVSRGYRFGFNHAVLFWCFMVLLLANIEFILHGLFPNTISLAILPEGWHFSLAFLFDIASALALAAVIIAMSRRLFFPPPHIEAKNPDAFVILTLVAVLMMAFFGLHGIQIAQGQERAAGYMPVSNLVSHIFQGETGSGAVNFFWWLHAIVFLGFLNYLPYSKHLHIITGIPNCYFRSLAWVNTQPREEFKEGNSFGVERIDQFTWKALFDSYACTKCGRCSDQCPATATNKVLDPRLVIGDIKANLLVNGPRIRGTGSLQPLIVDGQEGSVSERALWECTTCGACMEVCPVFIEHVPHIVKMRRALVEMRAKFPEEMITLFENMEQRYNPWGIAPSERVKWAADIEVKTFDKQQTEYLFFVGCAGAFDARNRRVTVALSQIMNTGGISWGILGKEEMCCGDNLRRLGNEYVFDRIARDNVKMFQDKCVTRVITQCPHCYNTLKNDYRQFGLNIEVFHHTEIINQLLMQGKLKINSKPETGSIVFHDSCYLGRHNSIYEAPRQVITSATGRPPLEMERNRNRSFCCGAGGGLMWMEESEGEHIHTARVKQALAKQAGTICVSCPYCLTMFEDGLKDLNAEGQAKVLDIAEVVAGTLNKTTS
jgi:Fe-S oxidoreductase/nitrate reductase gamma subunit